MDSNEPKKKKLFMAYVSVHHKTITEAITNTSSCTKIKLIYSTILNKYCLEFVKNTSLE